MFKNNRSLKISINSFLMFSILMGALQKPACARANNGFKRYTKKQSCTEYRGVVDIGSGKTEASLFEVDVCNKKILKNMGTGKSKVSFADDLAAQKKLTGQDVLSDSIIDYGTDALSKVLSAVSYPLNSYEAKKVKWKAFATSAFRQANNGEAVLKKWESYFKFPFVLVSQTQEAQLAYVAVSKVEKKFDPVTDWVWDIGGGSQQLTNQKETAVLLEDRGSSRFRKTLISTLYPADPNRKSANPIANAFDRAVTVAISFCAPIAGSAASTTTLATNSRSVGRYFGAGPVHQSNLRRLVANYNTSEAKQFTRQQLLDTAKNLSSLTDAQLNDPHAESVVTNLILVAGCMEVLGINQITISTAGAAEGAVFELFP
jgi:exopolyphosphatase/pppGpp-phosphohydrolase